MAIVAALFPADHPYHWLTIGEADDLRAATLDDVRAFFQRYYHPANASLAIAGDVDTDEALALVEQLLRRDSRRAPPVAACDVAPPALAGEARLVLEDRVELPRLYLAWHSPALFADGDAELDLVADVLAERQDLAALSQRSSTSSGSPPRWPRRRTRASSAASSSRRDGRAGPHARRARARDRRGDRRASPTTGRPTTRWSAAARRRRRSSSTGCRRVGGFGGKADQLNAYNVFLGEPGYFERDLARYRERQRRRRCSSAAAK